MIMQKRSIEQTREMLECSARIETLNLSSCVREIEGVELGEREVPFIITTTDVDRYDDIILSTGGKTENYEKNPVVLAFHDSRNRMPVAKSNKLIKESSRILSIAEFGSVETLGSWWGEVANSFFLAYKNGFMNATSIGFIPLDWTWDEKLGGYIITEWELLEYSCVPIPANPHALQVKDADLMKRMRGIWEQFLDEQPKDSPVYQEVEKAHQSTSPKSALFKMGEPFVLRLKQPRTRVRFSK